MSKKNEKPNEEPIDDTQLAPPENQGDTMPDVPTPPNIEVKSDSQEIDVMQFIADFPGIRMSGNYLEVAFKSYCRNNKINDKVSMDTWVKRFEFFKTSPPSKPFPDNLKPKTKQRVGG